MAERKKVASLQGVRVVSQPAAGNVDVFAAPKTNPLTDIVGSLQGLNKNLSKYGEAVQANKDQEDMMKLEFMAQEFKRDKDLGLADRATIKEIYPSLSPLVQARLTQRLGEMYGEDFITNKIKEISLDPEAAYKSDKRKGYYDKFEAELLEEVKDREFFGNGALTKARALLRQRENNYLEAEFALTKDIQANGFTKEIGSTIANSELSIIQIQDSIAQIDNNERNQGGINTGPELIILTIDSAITAAKSIAIENPERALEILGDVNENGEIVGGVIPKMMGDANVHGTQKYKDKIIDAQISLRNLIEKAQTKTSTENAAFVKSKIGTIKTELSLYLDERAKNGDKTFFDVTAWVKEKYPEVVEEGIFSEGNVLGTIEDRFDTIMGRPNIDPKISLNNKDNAFQAIKALALTGNINSLQNVDNDSATIIEEYFANNTGGVVELTDDAINEIADQLNLNQSEYADFRNNVNKFVEAANKARESHAKHFEREFMHNSIKTQMAGLSANLTKTINQIYDTPLNMEANIKDLFDNFIHNRYMDIILETGKEPTSTEMGAIYSAAQTRVNEELAQYTQFAEKYLRGGLNEEQKKSLKRPEQDNLPETIRINQRMQGTITAEDLQQAGLEGIEPGEYVVRRVDINSEEPNTYMDGNRRFKIEKAIEPPPEPPTEEEIIQQEEIKKEEELANRPPEEKIKLSTEMITTETYDPPGNAKPMTKVTDIKFDDEQKQIISSMYAEIFDDLTKKKANTTNVKVSQNIQPERDAKKRIYKAVIGDMKWKGTNEKFIEDMIDKIISDSISVN